MKKLIFLCSFLFVCISSVCGQSNLIYADRDHLDAISEARNYVDSLREVLKTQGLAVSISIKDKMVWSEGFGYADIETSEPITEDTKFRIGSVSKSLTSIGLMKLVEQGKLSLDDNVQTYLPDFPKKKFQFTIRQLATHQAGISHYSKEDYYINERFNSLDESLEIFQDRDLAFEPGTNFLYSTFGYVLLSAVMEEASGMDFLDYMQKEVFEPLGIRNTVPDDLGKDIPHKATFYMPGEQTPLQTVDLSYKWAGGGYLSTTSDMIKIIDQLDDLISEESIEQLWTPAPLRNGEMNPQSYTMGWRKKTTDSGEEIIHHGGLSPGGRAFVATLLKEDMTVVLLANSTVQFDLKEALSIVDFFRNQKPNK